MLFSGVISEFKGGVMGSRRVIFAFNALLLAFLVSGTKACREDYIFLNQVNIGTATGTPDDSVATTTPTITATGTSEPDATSTPETTATATPEPTASSLVINELLGTGAFSKQDLKSLDDSNVGVSATGGQKNTTKNLGPDHLGKAFSKSKNALLDTDGDGFTDIFEEKCGSDPEDNNSMPDRTTTNLERRVRTNDRDLDGLIDSEEVLKGTNISNPDTDGDGCSDGDEVRSESDPLDRNSKPQDSDGDCLSDSFEKEFSLNPNSNDSDSDGVYDNIELQLNSDPLKKDSDGDGIYDWQEIKRGTDPILPDTCR